MNALKAIIRLSTDTEAVATKAVAALALDGRTYQQRGKLVEICTTGALGSKTPLSDSLFLSGTPRIREVPFATLSERLATSAKWERLVRRPNGEFVVMEVTPPPYIVHQVLNRPGWEGIPELVGITEAPALRHDMTILQDEGYDPASGWFYIPSQVFERIPDSPTAADATESMRVLLELFADFPFNSHVGRYVPIAALLTLFARPAIAGAVPLFSFDASTRGSGKTLIADLISIVAAGRPASHLTYPRDAAELEKIMASCALAGIRILSFDNVAELFGGPPIDKILTCRDRTSFRILGKNETPDVPWRATSMVNGNNMTFHEDTLRRTLVARLTPATEHPEDRSDFLHPDVVSHAVSERAAYVRAALIMLRAFAVGSKSEERRGSWGSFEPWSSLVPLAISFAGGPDILAARAREDSGNENIVAHSVILDDLPRAFGDQGVTCAKMIDTLFPRDGSGTSFVELREAFEILAPSDRSGRPDTRSLGKALGALRERVRNGRKLVGVAGQGRIKKWKVESVTGPEGGSV